MVVGKDAGIEAAARRAKLPVVQGVYGPPPFERTLYVAPKTGVPWDMLPAAWHFLERWDAAVPLWRYGVLAEGVGTKEERKRTQAIVRDLRVLLYSHELLFVRASEDGKALMAAFGKELAGGGETRLAFLRAFYRVKPRMCVLPRSWLAEVEQRSKQDARAVSTRRRSANAGKPLVRVEISPGRFVQCHRGDEAQVREDFAKRMTRRGKR